MRDGWPLILLCACGRFGFESVGGGKDAHAAFPDVAYHDAPGTFAPDAPPAPDGGPGACADFGLGSALGIVAAGNTTGQGDMYSQCGGGGSPDVTYAWTAPAAGMYTIDLCNGPDQSFDSALTVLDSSCTGTKLACDDDGCGTWLSKVHVTLAQGQHVIIVVDGYGEMGKYALTITQN